MGKTIERHNLNIKLHVPLFFPRLLSKDGAQRSGAHRHSHAPSRVRAAHACSYHYLCHEQKRLCPLVSHETDEPSSRPAQKQNSVLAATAVSARIRADQVAGGMHPHMTSSSRVENMIMTAVRGGGGAKCHPDPTPRAAVSQKPSEMVVPATRHAQSDDQHCVTWPLAHARA